MSGAARPLPLFGPSRAGVPCGSLQPPLGALAPGTVDLQRTGPAASDFVSGGNQVVAAFADGFLRAFDSSELSETWRAALAPFDRASRFDGAPLIVEDSVLVRIGEDWTIRDLGTGELRTRFTGPQLALRRGVILDGAAIATHWTDSGAALARLDLASGALAWSTTLEGPADTFVTGADGVVALAETPARFSGFDAGTGERLWSVDVSEIGARRSAFGSESGAVAGWAVAVGDLITLPVRWSHWLGLDPRSGAERWRTRLNTHNPGVAALPDPATLLILGDEGVFALDTATGVERWARPIDKSAFGVGLFGAPAASESHLFAVHVHSGRLAAIGSADGAVAWIGERGGMTPPDSPPLPAGGWLVTADIEGRTRLYRSRGS